MICGKRLNRIWLVLLSLSLLFLVSGNVLADSETEDCEYLLNECGNRLETTTNELENALNTIDAYRTLTSDQASLITDQNTLIKNQNETISERDDRLIQIENSFNDYEKQTRKTILINRWTGRAEGAGVGAILTLLLVLFL